MPDPQKLVETVDLATQGLNRARNAVEQWRRGKVAGVNHTAAQRAALKTEFETGLQVAKDGITSVDAELLN